MDNFPKIGLIGFGNMGKEIKRVADGMGIEITDVFDINDKIVSDKKYQFDVAIDFTEPKTVTENVRTIAKLGKNIVIGTTGWDEQKQEVEKIVFSENIGLVYGSNFSIGMMMFSQLVKEASKLVDSFKDYDIMLHEIHHRHKKDSPSGTALSLAKIILENVNSKKYILSRTSEGPIDNGALHVTSTRGGEIFGKHSIYLDSLADTIELTHNAKNRSGFAQGALLAAKWINYKKGIFEFNDVFKDLSI
ncbi:MAG: 4-hydroxy-tetrahydrodipicolinate reductase [Bacteroidota bacterium]